MQDLFEEDSLEDSSAHLPLAYRMAPRTLEEFAGQKHLLGEGKSLRRAIAADRIGSAIFYGPAGCGKSALAGIISRTTSSFCVRANAVTLTTAQLRAYIEASEMRRQKQKRRTLIVIDEFHHFNKTQQDVLLPDVERGTFILIGITTENPFYTVHKALLSRSQVYRFEKLADSDIALIIQRALRDEECGLGALSVHLDDRASKYLIAQAEGDARRALNVLEIASRTTSSVKGVIAVDIGIIEDCMQIKSVFYDRSGDGHYDTISAFIKSMRGCDPDAAVYWLAKMLAAGEDPRFIMRRLLIFACEDIGNADPHALVLANAAAQACEMTGMPESELILAQVTTYLASAPKSNASAKALWSSKEDIKTRHVREVPAHLTKRGKASYQYPHGRNPSEDTQVYMNEHSIYYEPSERGYEKTIKMRLNKIRSLRRERRKSADEDRRPATEQ